MDPEVLQAVLDFPDLPVVKKKRTGFGLRGSFKVRMWVGGLSCSDSNNPAGRKTRRRRERESLRHSMEGDYPVSIRETSRLRDCCVYMPPLYDLSEVFQGVGCAATGVVCVYIGLLILRKES